MKTVVVTLEYPPQIGGIASYVERFLEHVPSDQYVVIAPPMTGSTEVDKKHPWKTYRRSPYFFLWPRWLRLFWSTYRIVKKEKADRLFIHHVLPVGTIGYYLKKLKIISSYRIFLHGTDVRLATRPGKVGLFKKILTQAEAVYVNSEFLQHHVEKYVDGVVITVLYPAPADAFFSVPDATAVNTIKDTLALHGKKVIITVARLAEGKGFPLMIRLLPEILKKVPNAVWVIIGDGPKRTEIITLLQKNNLQNVVRFLGSVPAEELPAYYATADLFALLTHAEETQEESWGTVFIEAAAAGLPVVAGRAGGSSEAVEDRVTGLVVDTHQEKAVANDIIGLLTNAAFAKQMGTAGRERALSDFTWEKQIKKIITV